ncbi:MAG: alpha/beta fold hydrolase [Alphaproteobacteria bacterium]|nr:alpha/beta fold hydrolase [Alphaproteobacteria bacterium]
MSRLPRGPGAAIHYETHGEGPAVLLSHGFGLTARMWAGQVEALAPANRLVLWDLRGHGRSDSPEDPGLYDPEACVADMAALLDAEGIERAVVGGLSLGGYLSLAFHLRHPERVRALMLFDCGPGFRRDEPREAWNERTRKRSGRIAAGDARALAELEPDGHRDLAGVARAARWMMLHHDGSVLESLPSVRAPALVVVGEHDTPFRGAADYMARKIPNAERVVLPGAGHTANLDSPEAFNAAVSAFLARLPA